MDESAGNSRRPSSARLHVHSCTKMKTLKRLKVLGTNSDHVSNITESSLAFNFFYSMRLMRCLASVCGIYN